MEFMEKILTEQKKVMKQKTNESETFFAVRKNIL